MTTRTKSLSTGLRTRIFAFTLAMALLLAFVSTTSESATADLAAANLTEPTRLVFQNVLAA